MKNIEIKINRNTSMVYLENTILGNDGENLQGDIIFSFADDFVDGQARLEYEIEGEKRYLFLTKEDKTYKTPIKSVLTKSGAINMQLVITEGVSEDEIPIFKSNVFYVYCNDSLNAEIEQPDEYPSWIEVANTKLNEVDNLNIEMQDNIVTITKKDGTQYSENVKGDAYEITKEDYEEIESQVKEDIQPILEEIENASNRAEIIARGKAQTKTFKTFVELEVWLRDVSNKGILKQGDNLYIEAIYTDSTETKKQPDYWVTATLDTPNEEGYYYNISELGAETPVLTDYAKKDQFITLTQTEYDNLETKSSHTYYFIIEEE